MGTFKAFRGVVLAVCLAVGLFGVVANGAIASTLCLQLKANGGVKAPETVGGTKCKAGYEAVQLPSANEMEVLKHMTYNASGIGGKPTIQVSGVNVQIESGTGSESTVNGEGNLIIGSDESPRTQTGSNNVVLGSDQQYTSYGALLGGDDNSASGPFSDAFGFGNTATGEESAVSGGGGNTASGLEASVSGGAGNEATQFVTSVSGGYLNKASEEDGSVSGGGENTAAGISASVSGGEKNTATGEDASVGGGVSNKVSGQNSSITGGEENTVSGLDSSITGGFQNIVEANASTVLGAAGHILKGSALQTWPE